MDEDQHRLAVAGKLEPFDQGFQVLLPTDERCAVSRGRTVAGERALGAFAEQTQNGVHPRPLRRVAAQQALGEPCQVLRQTGDELFRRYRVLGLLLLQHFDEAAADRPAASQRLVEEHAHRVPVAGLGQPRAGGLLRRHVGWRASQLGVDGELAVGREQFLNQAEIEQYHPAAVVDPDVRWLDVAV